MGSETAPESTSLQRGGHEAGASTGKRSGAFVPAFPQNAAPEPHGSTTGAPSQGRPSRPPSAALPGCCYGSQGQGPPAPRRQPRSQRRHRDRPPGRPRATPACGSDAPTRPGLPPPPRGCGSLRGAARSPYLPPAAGRPQRCPGRPRPRCGWRRRGPGPAAPRAARPLPAPLASAAAPRPPRRPALGPGTAAQTEPAPPARSRARAAPR